MQADPVKSKEYFESVVSNGKKGHVNGNGVAKNLKRAASPDNREAKRNRMEE